MLAKIAGRLITGPLAFFVAGLVDFLTYGLASLRERQAARRSASD